MIKKIIFIVLIVFLATIVRSEGSEIYQNSNLRLETVATFGDTTDWPSLFGERAARMFEGHPMLGEQYLTVSADGSVFVSNTGNFLIYQFDSRGNLVRKFQNPEKIPPDSSPTNRRPEMLSILDNRLLLVCEPQGRINVFDLKGNRKELAKYDYSVYGCFPLGGGKVAVFGGVGMGSGDWKTRVAVQDFPLGKEREIYSMKQDLSRTTIWARQGEGKGMVGTAAPFSGPKIFPRVLKNGELLIGNWNSPEIWIYSPNGAKRLAFRIEGSPKPFPEVKKEEYVENLKKSMAKNPDLTKQLLAELEKKPEFFPSSLPLFSEILIDGAGNILVFDFREDEELSFTAYTPEGKKTGRCTLNCGDFVFPQGLHNHTAFFQGEHLYVLAAPRKNPKALRLIKARLVSI